MPPPPRAPRRPSPQVPYREMTERLQAALPGTALQRLADPSGEVAKNFRLAGHVGSVSFITSMTQHFCGDCNRQVGGWAVRGWGSRRVMVGGGVGRGRAGQGMEGVMCCGAATCAP